ncbi:MAG: DUF3899 domain-containing protein [Erysipelotrichaceae bacterium]|nr:DUF3899 domain-containing protein [Erysipelotrichaceae bacterium]
MPKENSNIKSVLLRYGITFGVCLVASFLFALLMGLFTPWQELKQSSSWNFDSELTKVMFVLTNGTFSVGALATCFGLLIMAANGGAFEMLSYGIKRFISLFQKDINKIKFKTFYDYHVYNSSKPKTPFLFLVFVGLFFLALSAIFLIIYLVNYVPVIV